MVADKHFFILQWMLIAWLLPGMSLAQQSPIAPPSPITVLVCYPGGSVRTQDAESAMGSMLRVLEENGGWASGTMTSLFTSQIEDSEKFLSEQKPQFAITTLGTFLQYREKLNLIPLVQPRIQGSSLDKYRIVVRRGTFATVEELKGKTLAGLLVEEDCIPQSSCLPGECGSGILLRPEKLAAGTSFFEGRG